MAKYRDKKDINIFNSPIAAKAYKDSQYNAVEQSKNLYRALMYEREAAIKMLYSQDIFTQDDYFEHYTENKIKDLVSPKEYKAIKRRLSKINSINNSEDFIDNFIGKIENRIDGARVDLHASNLKYALNVNNDAMRVVNNSTTTVYKTSGKKVLKKASRQNDKMLNTVIEELESSKFFKNVTQLQSNKAINSTTDFMLAHTDFKGVNIKDSMKGINAVNDKLGRLMKGKTGFLHSIDTETLGATTSTGIWKPTYVTEFAKITTDFSTGKTSETNIFLSGREAYQKEFDRLKTALTNGAQGRRDIENDPSLRVSLERFALYGHGKTNITYNKKLGYSQVTSMADISDINNLYDLDLITTGYNKMMGAASKPQTIITSSGRKVTIKSDVKAYIDSMAEIQHSIAAGQGVINGYNVKGFDMKTINMQLQNVVRNDPEAFEYAKHAFAINAKSIEDIRIHDFDGSVLDMQSLTRAYTANKGQASLIGDELFNRIHGQRPNRQEYIGERYYPHLMKDASHVAINDTRVVHSMVLDNAEGMDESLFSFLHKELNNIYGSSSIDNNTLLFSNKGTAFNSDRDVLSFSRNIKSGDISFSSGHYIKDGKVGWSQINQTRYNGVDKNGVYSIGGISKVNAKQFSKTLGTELPDYASNELFVVNLKQVIGVNNGVYKFDNEEVFKVFGSSDEMEGFLSSTFSNLGGVNQKSGLFEFNKGMEDQLLHAWNVKDIYKTESKSKWKNMADADKVAKYVSHKDNVKAQKGAHNFLFGNNKSAKKMSGMLDFIDEMRKSGYGELLNDKDKLLQLYNNDIPLFGLSKKDVNKISNIFSRNLGFMDSNTKKYTLLDSTAHNAIYALDHTLKLEDYYKTLMEKVAGVKVGKKGYKDLYLNSGKSAFDSIFLESNKSVMAEAALKVYKGDFDRAMEASSFVTRHSDIVGNLSNIYDFKLSDKFMLSGGPKNTKKFNVLSSNDNYITIDTSKTDAASAFINDLTSKFLGNTQVYNNDVQYRYQRAAFQNFVRDINKNSRDYRDLFGIEDFSNMIEDVIENDNFDLHKQAQVFIDSINTLKSDGKNLNAGIKKSRYSKHTNINKELSDELLSIARTNDSAIDNAIKNVNIVELNKSNKETLIDSIVRNRMFNKEEFFKNANFLYDEEEKVADIIYDKFEKKLRTTVKDMIEAADDAGSSIAFDSDTGAITLLHGEKSMPITELPSLKHDGKYLYSQTDNGTKYEMHLLGKVNKHGKVEIDVNLGGDFGIEGAIQRRTRQALNNGTYTLEVIDRKMVRNLSEHKESSIVNFSKKDIMLGNYKIDLAKADRVFDLMFGENSTAEGRDLWLELVASGKLDSTNIAKYSHLIKEITNDDMLSPTLRSMTITDIPRILEAFANDKPTEEILRMANATIKDTDVSKGMQGATPNAIVNAFNIFDNLGRPTIVSQMNAKYLRSNTVEGTKKFYENLLIGGSIIEDKKTIKNIYSNLNVGLKEAIGVQTDFTYSAAYLGTLGLNDQFDLNMDRVINGFKFNSSLEIKEKDAVRRAYGILANNYTGATFEQSRIVDSRLIDSIMSETTQDIQRLSGLKDLSNAIDIMTGDAHRLGHDINKLERISDMIGNISIDKNTNEVIFNSENKGALVKRNENIFKLSTYGGGTTSFASKFDEGIASYAFRTKEGLKLTDKEVSELLTIKLSQELKDKSKEDAQEMIERLNSSRAEQYRFLMEDFENGVLGSFEVRNVRDADLIKSGASDKGMNYIVQTKAGELDNRLADFLTLTGRNAGTESYSPEAIRLMVKEADHSVINVMSNMLNIKTSREEVANILAGIRETEKHEYSRMIFGKGGIFDGRISAVINDNLPGHGNIGTTTEGTFSKAVEMYSKYYGKGSNSTEKYESAMDDIIQMINDYNNDFQFIKKVTNVNGSSTHIGYQLERSGSTFILKDEKGIAKTLNESAVLDQESLTNLVRHIDSKLEQAGANIQDRLVHKDVYMREGDKWVKKDEIIGNYILNEREIDGKKVMTASGGVMNVNNKILNDSEVQSYVSAEYLKNSENLYKAEKFLDQLKKTNQNKDLIDMQQIYVDTLREYVNAEEPYSRRVKVDDRYRNILSAHKLDEVTEADLSKRFQQGRMSESYKDALREFALIGDKNIQFKDKLETDNVFGSWLDDIRGLMTYDKTKEQKLTRDMLKDDKYAKYENLYNFVEGLGMELGVNSAERIHGIQGAYLSDIYNRKGGADIEAQLIKDHGFKNINIAEYARNYGRVNNQLDNISGQGYVIDLGSDFGNRRIAVPGMGNVSGDQEIRKEWGKSFDKLTRAYDEYSEYIGSYKGAAGSIVNDEEFQKLKGKVELAANEIGEKTGEVINKQGEWGRAVKIEASAPYLRGKLLSINDSMGVRGLAGDTAVPLSQENMQTLVDTSFKSKAMINGKTLAEWEKGGLKDGVFFDYGTFGINQAEKLGLLDESYYKKLGMNSREEMIEHLETHGTMMLADRYPNVRKDSVQNVRFFLNKNDRVNNGASLAEWTMLKMNGDSDGDAISRMLLRDSKADMDFSQYSYHRQNAIKSLGSGATQEDIRSATIKNMMSSDKTLNNANAANAYDTFRRYEADATVAAASNIDEVAENVLHTMYKDEKKNVKLSGVAYDVSGLKNISAQIEGGKSSLGKFRIGNLTKAPGALDVSGGTSYYKKNTMQVNEMIYDIVQNKEALEVAGVDFGELKNINKLIDIRDKGVGQMHIGEIGNSKDQHALLDEVLSVIEKDKGRTLKTSVGDAEEVIYNRIRSDIYNQNAVSKSNKSVIGQVNAALYSIREASSNTLGKENDTKSRFLNSLINLTGYEMEEHVISSKKKVFDPGDERLMGLMDMLNGAKNPKKSLNQIKTDVGDWIFDYMGEDKINEIYQKSYVDKAGSSITNETLIKKRDEVLAANKILATNNPKVKLLNEEQAMAKVQANVIASDFVTGVNNIANDSKGKNEIQLHSIIARSSGTLAKKEGVDLNQLDEDAFATMAEQLFTGNKRIERPTINKIEPPKSKPKINLDTGERKKITESALRMTGDFVDKLSSGGGLAMGVVGLAAGMLISGYGAGNPLRDPKNDNIENKPQQIEGMSVPDFFDKNDGYVMQQQQRGYVINIKADTKRGQQYTKKAMKQLAKTSTNGNVNINMNFKSNNSGGYSDKDIEDIISNYI